MSVQRFGIAGSRFFKWAAAAAQSRLWIGCASIKADAGDVAGDIVSILGLFVPRRILGTSASSFHSLARYTYAILQAGVSGVGPPLAMPVRSLIFSKEP